MADVLTIGETMALLTSTTSERFKSSFLLQKNIGGAETNVAIGLSRLGHSTAWISRVGNDPFGEEILYRLRAEGIDVSNVLMDQNAQTGMMIKEKVRGNQTIVHYFRKGSAASNLVPFDLSTEQIRNAKILHVTGITPSLSDSCRETITEAIKLAKQNNTKVSLDPNLRLKLWDIKKAREVLLPLIKEADYFFPGLEEARLLLGDEELSPNQIIDGFLKQGIPNIILKLGKEGCITADQSNRFQVSGYPVVEIDPVGAGDAFCAGYLSGILSEKSPEECADLACAMGALAVTEVGDYNALPTRKEINEFMNKQSIIMR